VRVGDDHGQIGGAVAVAVAQVVEFLRGARGDGPAHGAFGADMF
jgi:hypothetical protein